MSAIHNLLIVWTLAGGVIAAISIATWRWKLVAINADEIKTMKEHCAETTKDIHKDLGLIGKQVSEIHGYILGKNGKDL